MQAVYKLQVARRKATDQDAKDLLTHAIKYLRHEHLGIPGCYSEKLYQKLEPQATRTCDCPIVFPENQELIGQVHRYNCPNAPRQETGNVRLAAPNVYGAKMRELLRVELKYLALGKTLELLGHNGAMGHIKYHSRGTYCLFDHSVTERACWGNLEEIAQDADFFMENGCLRPVLSPRW
jgi:hypothetical protein